MNELDIYNYVITIIDDFGAYDSGDKFHILDGIEGLSNLALEFDIDFAALCIALQTKGYSTYEFFEIVKI